MVELDVCEKVNQGELGPIPGLEERDALARSGPKTQVAKAKKAPKKAITFSNPGNTAGQRET